MKIRLKTLKIVNEIELSFIDFKKTNIFFYSKENSKVKCPFDNFRLNKMNANAVFLNDLRNKAKRKGASLKDLLEEIDKSQTGRMHINLFRKLVANTGLYVEDDVFLDMVEPYTKNNQFYYKQFIDDIDHSNTGDTGPKLSDDQLREFGAPLRDRGVDLIDFLRQWDRGRSGHVPTSVFLRNVSSTPIGQIVCRAYTNPVTNDVEYVKLAEDINRVLAAKYSENPIDPRKIQMLINQVADVIFNQKVDIFAEFQKIDRYKKRRIQPSQFLQLLSSIGVSNISPQDLADLADAFTENALFDYVGFCDEIDRATSIRASKKPAPQPVKIDMNRVLGSISREIVNRHSQLKMQLSQFDTRQTGLVPTQRFIRAMINQNFSISDKEIEAVAQEFGDDQGNVDYITFFSCVMPQKEPTVTLEDVLIRLQDYLNMKKIQIEPKLKKYDPRNTGDVQFSQLITVLREINFDLNNDELNCLKMHFSPNGSDGFLQISDISKLVDPIIEAPKPKPTLPRQEYVEPASVALEVMTRIGAIVAKYNLDIFDDFKRYDRSNTGLIKDAEFAAVIASLPNAPNERDIQALVNFYTNRTTHDINYESFCQEMDEFAMRRLQQNPEMTTKMMNELPQTNVSVAPILKRFKMYLYQTKTSPDVLFAPYDGGQRSGLIPETKLKPILDDFGFSVTNQELAVLADNFRDQRMPEKINYKRLCGELNAIQLTQRDLQMTQSPSGSPQGTTNVGGMKKTTNAEVLVFANGFREKLLERHKKIATPFVGMRSSSMPANDFRRCVESFGLVVKETDMQKLLREYKVNMQGDIDWQRFVHDVETPHY